MDPITAKALWGLLNLWRIVRLVWPVVREKRAEPKREEARREQARREQARLWEAWVATGRGWTMRDGRCSTRTSTSSPPPNDRITK